MAKKHAGPWLRNEDLCWYTTVGTKLIKLGNSDDSPEHIARLYAAAHGGYTVAEMVRRFLAGIGAEVTSDTLRWYAGYLNRFAREHGAMPVASLTASLLYSWIASNYGNLSPSAQHNAARTVVRAINWSIAERLLDRSPLVGFTKPAPSNRETILTAPQYALCLRLASPRLRTAIMFLWHTGCRPQELRAIEAGWIDGHKIVLPLAKGKGNRKRKRKRRVIYLNPTATRIAARLAGENTRGPIFRNAHGNPWSKGGLVCSFRRLRNKTGIAGLCAYSFRHAFITRLLESGVDVATVAALAGNSPRMVLSVYSHVTENETRLLQCLG